MTDHDSRVEAMAAHMEAAAAAETGDKGGFADAAERLGYEVVEEEAPDESPDAGWYDEDNEPDDSEDEWYDDEDDEPADRDAQLNARMDQLEALQQQPQPQWQPQPTEEERGLQALTAFDQHVSELAAGSDWNIDAEDRRELLRQSHAAGFTYASTERAFAEMEKDWDLYHTSMTAKGWQRRAARVERMARAIQRGNRDNE